MKSHVRSRWQGAILVCRKCSKKLKGGFGDDGKQPIAKVLRKALDGGKGRKARMGIVEVGCLDICPKGAVTLIDTAHPDEWLIVKAGTTVDDLTKQLGR